MNPQTPQKEARSRGSIERKLARKEVGRRFWLLVSLDILIVALFIFALIVRTERFAGDLSSGAPLTPSQKAGFEITETQESPNGVKVGIHISDRMITSDATRRLWFDNEYAAYPFYRNLEHLKYQIALPRETAQGIKYTVVTYSFYEAAAVFFQPFAILLIFEVIDLLFCYSKIRKSIRKSLRPIYDLTLAAQNMNRSANPVIALPEAPDLHLSGAIDTLNNITENDLDRRIVISDEREELRGLAEAINAMLDRLDAAYRSQLRFVSDASHELRTPIAVIQGYANLLDRWGKNDAVTLQESIDAIKLEASGMQDLVEQLLFLARSDNRSITLNIESVDLTALADEVIRETQMIDPSHEFKSNLNGALIVRGDLQLLKQAMRIFVDNAIKYTPKEGRITISTREEGEFAQIAVTDTGIGIPEGDLAKVFDRFFRADESRARNTGGTGLGLSIAKWIVDRHGGFVEIVSRVDIGTKIILSLPRAQDAAALTAPRVTQE